MGRTVGVVKQTFKDFGEDEGTRLAAALSYFTVFSLPPLLMIIVAILGAVMDPQQVEKLLAGQAGAIMGPAGGELRQIMQAAEQPGGKRGLAGVLGIAGLIFGATGAFLQLQAALNRIWEVRPDPAQGGVRQMLVKRLFSIGMLLTLVFLLIVSLVLTTFLEAFGDSLGAVLPEPLSGVFLQALTLAATFLLVAVLFGMMFKYMPDAEVNWKDVRVGAIVTAALFIIGKFALTLYLGRSNPGSAFGAAGALALLLVWIYYSAIIVFLGAEFTQAWAHAHGRQIAPERGAVRVIESTRTVRPTSSHEHALARGNKSGRAKTTSQPNARVHDSAAARAARDPALTMPRGPAVSLHDRKSQQALPQPPGARGWIAGAAATLLLRWLPKESGK